MVDRRAWNIDKRGEDGWEIQSSANISGGRSVLFKQLGCEELASSLA